MRDSQSMMIEKQAEIITQLRTERKHLIQKIEEQDRKIAALNRPATLYTAMINQIIANETLQAEWDRFLSMLKIAGDEEYLRKSGAFD